MPALSLYYGYVTPVLWLRYACIAALGLLTAALRLRLQRTVEVGGGGTAIY